MDPIQKIGTDATGAPSIFDWKKFYTNFIVPTYHHQPNLSMQIVPKPTEVGIDDKEVGEVYIENDVEDPVYEFQTIHKDTKLSGSALPVFFPKIQSSTLLSDQDLLMPFAGRNRLNKWTIKTISKIKDFADRKFFQGDSSKNVVGAIGSNSKDLGAPTGVWDVDTGSNGTLDNALADLNKFVNYFEDEGLGGRPITVCVSNEIMQLLRSTMVLYNTKNNVDLWMAALPPGSRILNSNNIQATAPAGGAADNYMVAFVDLLTNPEDGTSDEGGYQMWSSGIAIKTHKVDVDQTRFWMGMRMSVKVLDDAYVAWMDAIDCKT